MVIDSHAVVPHVIDVGIDLDGGIQRILAAVDDEQRLVLQVVGKDLLVEREAFVAQHQDERVHRQEAREGRRIAHREVIRAGPAVGLAGDRDAVLVHVEASLERVENRLQVGDLLLAPPRGLAPGVRHHGELRVRCKRPLSFACRVLLRRPVDVAVKLNADRISAQGIVPGGHTDHVAVNHPVLGLMAHLDEAGLLARIRPALFQAPDRLLECHARGDNVVNGLGSFRGCFRGPEFLEGPVDSSWLSTGVRMVAREDTQQSDRHACKHHRAWRHESGVYRASGAWADECDVAAEV